jgi:hypothetical protein
MNRSLMHAIWWECPNLRNSKQLLLLVGFTMYCSEDGYTCEIAMGELARATGASERLIRTHLRQLEKAGYLKITARSETTSQIEILVRSKFPRSHTDNVYCSCRENRTSAYKRRNGTH